jgi:hypothetical protein
MVSIKDLQSPTEVRVLLLAASGNFDDGLVQMASYLGNVILPVCAGIVLCIGVYHLAHQARSGERYLTAAMLCLLASGFMRLAEHFATQGSGQDQFYTALLSLTNWLANVVMPVYAGVNLVRGILSHTGSFELTSMGGNTARHFIVAVACLSISGGLRLLEWFVSTGAGGLH